MRQTSQNHFPSKYLLRFGMTGPSWHPRQSHLLICLLISTSDRPDTESADPAGSDYMVPQMRAIEKQRRPRMDGEKVEGESNAVHDPCNRFGLPCNSFGPKCRARDMSGPNVTGCPVGHRWLSVGGRHTKTTPVYTGRLSLSMRKPALWNNN